MSTGALGERGWRELNPSLTPQRGTEAGGHRSHRGRSGALLCGRAAAGLEKLKGFNLVPSSNEIRGERGHKSAEEQGRRDPKEEGGARAAALCSTGLTSCSQQLHTAQGEGLEPGPAPLRGLGMEHRGWGSSIQPQPRGVLSPFAPARLCLSFPSAPPLSSCLSRVVVGNKRAARPGLMSQMESIQLHYGQIQVSTITKAAGEPEGG